MRLLLAFLFCFVVAAARAASPAYPCPTFVAGWALSGLGPITTISWDSISQQMYFVWKPGLPPNATTVTDYYPVPNSSVMQTFSSTPQANWVQTFNYLIAPSYHAVLLKESDNCPVLQESYPVICLLLDEDGLSQLITETTNAILTTDNPFCPSLSPGGFIWVN